MPMMNIRLYPMGRRRCRTAPASNSLCRYASQMGSTCHVTGKLQIHTIHVWAPFGGRHRARSARHPVTAALGACRAVLPLRLAPSPGELILAHSRRQMPRGASHSGRRALWGGGSFGAPPAAGVDTGTWGGWAPPSSPPAGAVGGGLVWRAGACRLWQRRMGRLPAFLMATRADRGRRAVSHVLRYWWRGY